MILLIPDARTEADKKTTAFKFHYDSINSLSESDKLLDVITI